MIYEIAQILRGAETIKRMHNHRDTHVPISDRNEKCPHCGAPRIERDDVLVYWCGTVDKGTKFSRSLMCKDPILLPKLLREIDEVTDRVEELETEVERLRNGMRGSCYCCEPVGHENQKLEAEVERLTSALKSCWHCANTYDGNYAKACDNVATIVTNALKTQDDK